MARPFVCATLLALSGFAVPSLADADSDRVGRHEVRAQLVKYGDLSLDSAAGADALVRRIETAARDVCGDRPGPRGLTEHRFVRQCARAAGEAAVYEVGHPMVIGRYFGRTPDIIISEDAPRHGKDADRVLVTRGG
jgi:UrcA family protein